MEKLRAVVRWFKRKYALLTARRYTTLAGTLVFFLLTSLLPLAFWLSLLVARLPFNGEEILHLRLFGSVSDVLLYVQKEARAATAGASVVLVLTTLYASSNLFYQMRRSGEMIYGVREEGRFFRLRLGALVLLIIVLAAAVVLLVAFAVGHILFARLLSRTWELVADYALLGAAAFGLCLLLNMYTCPYKAKVRQFFFGTAFSVSAWFCTGVGFSLYLKISNIRRLYGALSTLILFLLWLYALTLCFVVGVILNSEKILKERNRLGHKKGRKGKY